MLAMDTEGHPDSDSKTPVPATPPALGYAYPGTRTRRALKPTQYLKLQLGADWCSKRLMKRRFQARKATEANLNLGPKERREGGWVGRGAQNPPSM